MASKTQPDHLLLRAKLMISAIPAGWMMGAAIKYDDIGRRTNPLVAGDL